MIAPALGLCLLLATRCLAAKPEEATCRVVVQHANSQTLMTGTAITASHVLTAGHAFGAAIGRSGFRQAREKMAARSDEARQIMLERLTVCSAKVLGLSDLIQLLEQYPLLVPCVKLFAEGKVRQMKQPIEESLKD